MLFRYIKAIFVMLYTYYIKLKLFYYKKLASKKREREMASLYVRRWAKMMAKTLGAEIEIEGTKNLPKGNCFFVGNHQGYADILAILAKMPKDTGFVAKKELGNIPIVTYWMKQIDCVFLDRENPREAIKTFNSVADILKSGHSMVIFPEGTRSKGGPILEFKKGSLKIASKIPNIPIVPIALKDTYKLYEENKKVQPTKCKISIGEPIYFDKLEKEEKANIHGICEEKVRELYSKL